MILRNSKNIHCQLSLLMLILICAGCSNNSKKSESNEFQEWWNALKGLELNIAVVVSDKEAARRLAFIAKNNSNVDITVPEFPLGENRVEIFRPNRKRPGIFSIQSSNSEYTIIKPSESKIWYMDEELFNLISLEEGINRFVWKIGDVESPELLLFKEIDKEEN